MSDISVCNVLDLSRFEENSFDVVLCMGAMYHLLSPEEKQKAIMECTHICKSNGFVVLSYLNKYALIAAEILPGLENIEDILGHADDPNSIFQSTTPGEMIRLSEASGLNILYNLGIDGVSFILRDKVNLADDKNFDKWMEFIYETCEDQSAVGYSMHGLLIGRKQ